MTFDELYAAHADRVYSFLRFKIRDIYLVEDIFQETFLAAYRELSAGRLPKHPKSWLLTVAHRRMVDRLRRLPAGETALEDAMPASSSGPGEWTDAMELKEWMARLDEASRTILYSLYVEGLSIRETAQLLGIPEGTVKSRCHAAKSKLSGWMKEGRTDGA